MTDKKENEFESSDTQETDVLMSILHELKKMRDEQAERDENLEKRISDLERKLQLVSVEITRQGETMATLEQHCRNRLKICTKHGLSRSGDSWPVQEVCDGEGQ